MPFDGRKCRECQLTIKTENGEQLTVYDRETYHSACFDKWAQRRVKKLQSKKKLEPTEQSELDDLKDIIKIARPIQ